MVMNTPPPDPWITLTEGAVALSLSPVKCLRHECLGCLKKGLYGPPHGRSLAFGAAPVARDPSIVPFWDRGGLGPSLGHREVGGLTCEA